VAECRDPFGNACGDELLDIYAGIESIRDLDSCQAVCLNAANQNLDNCAAFTYIDLVRKIPATGNFQLIWVQKGAPRFKS
jgi:hypothetical protein